jgi:hypothetical protein
VIRCRSSQQAAAALAVVQRWTAEGRVSLHPTKTRVVNATEDGFDFLGYRFEAGRRRPRDKSLKRNSRTRSGPRPSIQRGTASPASLKTSTARCAAGLNTSSTAIARHTRRSTAGSVGGCAFCASNTAGRGSRAVTTISSGPTPSLPNMAFSACMQPRLRYASPLAGNTINRRAGCGRSARPVRRARGSDPIGPPYPYQRHIVDPVRPIGHQ